MALTNNTDRGKAGTAGADEANPRNLNKHGHILELAETGTTRRPTFRLALLLVGGPADPSPPTSPDTKEKVGPISCPDNVTFDPHGNLVDLHRRPALNLRLARRAVRRRHVRAGAAR